MTDTIPRIVTQFDGSTCQSGNCGAATAAWLEAFANGRAVAKYSGGHMRTLAEHPCKPGDMGLYSSDLERALAAVGVASEVVAQSSMTEARERLAAGWAMAALGDYDAVENTPFEQSESFQGDHWVGLAGLFMWADPIRRSGTPMGIPPALFERYWITFRKNTTLGRGRAIYVAGPSVRRDSMITVSQTSLLRLPMNTQTYEAPNGPPLHQTALATQDRPFGAVKGAPGWYGVNVTPNQVEVWAYVKTTGNPTGFAVVSKPPPVVVPPPAPIPDPIAEARGVAKGYNEALAEERVAVAARKDREVPA